MTVANSTTFSVRGSSMSLSFRLRFYRASHRADSHPNESLVAGMLIPGAVRTSGGRIWRYLRLRLTNPGGARSFAR